jgi:ElaB/YqjD/DUF883 family membrane-anchored ribosome-binding protein
MENKLDDKELRKLLDQLHDEINNTKTIDDKGRELLSDLESDIHALLERSGSTPEQSQSTLVQRLESALDHFEVTHPDLTMLISRLLESLSNAGI